MSKKIIDYLLSGLIWGLTALAVIIGGIFLYRNGYQDGFDDGCRGSTPDIVQSQSVSLHTADTVSNSYYYSGSNFPVLMSLYNKHTIENMRPEVSETVVTDYIPLKFSFGQLFPDTTDNYIRIDYPGSFFLVSITDFINGTFVNWEHFHIVFAGTSFYPDGVLVGSIGIGSNVTSSIANFNFDVRYFLVRVEQGYHGNSSLVKTHINFYDSNGNDIGFTFGITPGTAPGQNQLINSSYVSYVWSVTFPSDYSYSLTSRIYYLSTSLSDNEIYQSGVSYGNSVGYSRGLDDGYNDGYSKGEKVGKKLGFNEGVASANQYSFSSLLTAVVDAPIHVFIDLLNFEIMGYNLLNLVVGLLTFAVIVLVLKLILGGK